MRTSALLLLVGLLGCEDIISPAPPGWFDEAPLVPMRAAPSGGHVLVRAVTERGPTLLRFGLAAVGAVEDVGLELDGFAPGVDLHAAPSPNGAWIALATTRFGCDDGPCVALAAADLGSVRRIRTAAGGIARAESAAPSDDGRVVAYAGAGGPHERDVFVVTHADEVRRATPWSEPVAVSARSSFRWNRNPRVSPDGARVVFDCGDEPADDAARSICEVAASGGEVHVRIGAAAAPPDAELLTGALAYPQPTPDGALVFEADWYGASRLFRAGAPSDGASPLGSLVDVGSPCVLPDGRVVALWRGRAGNRAGLRELTIADAAGAAPRVLLRDRDALAGSVGCSL